MSQKCYVYLVVNKLFLNKSNYPKRCFDEEQSQFNCSIYELASPYLISKIISLKWVTESVITARPGQVARVKNPVHRGGLPQCMLGYPPPSRHPRKQTPTPQKQTPPCTVHAGRYGQQAGGMHPTGMQSCLMSALHILEKAVLSYHQDYRE